MIKHLPLPTLLLSAVCTVALPLTASAECYGYNCVNLDGQSMSYNESNAWQYRELERVQLEERVRSLENDKLHDEFDNIFKQNCYGYACN